MIIILLRLKLKFSTNKLTSFVQHVVTGVDWAAWHLPDGPFGPPVRSKCWKYVKRLTPL